MALPLCRYFRDYQDLYLADSKLYFLVFALAYLPTPVE
ncbi:Uncharacterised protein [Klebsiella variicola]|nr:Uncharacterised protein [Klebsiella variicola]